MNSASLASIGTSLANVAAAIAERVRQQLPSNGAVQGPFAFVDAAFDSEVESLRLEGQDQLADTLTALRGQIGEMDNG